jgi:hypothetical protein
MPLIKGRSRAVIGHNIEEMEAAGHPRRVAVAAALNTADRSRGHPGRMESLKGRALTSAEKARR